jgi:hypothetical protein
MIDWKQGGWTGSLNAWVRREIRQHFRENASARRSRYPGLLRTLHRIFDNRTFGQFVAVYMVLAVLVGFAEFISATCYPGFIARWSGKTDISSLLTNATDYLITAQVGVLAVVSIAIGLVTIIAQRENASTDVQVYYHESLAFGVVASSIALLAALCVQLVWPIQFALGWFGYGAGLNVFKVILTSVHIAWLVLNLGGMAHFVATTLVFVQQTAREGLRERYTTNVVMPAEMRRRLREQLYLGAGPGFVEEFWSGERDGWHDPVIYLGRAFGGGDVEIPLRERAKLTLNDVRMGWVRWALGRWLRRCRAANPDQSSRRAGGLADRSILLLFPPRLDEALDVSAGLCRRRGGVPLTGVEKLVLRWAFKFRRDPE